MLLNEIKAPKVNVLKLKQFFFWINTSILIKFQDDRKLMEHFVVFLKYFFKGIKFENFDEESLKLIFAIFRINFVNSNYTFIESKISTENERNQHWMIFLLTMLQQSYYDVAKTHYAYNDNFDNMISRFDQFLQNIEKDENIYSDKIEMSREHFELKDIFPHSKDYVVKALVQCTNNLLTHKYYKTHPRRFVMDYIRSLKTLLSLKSRSIFKSVGEWIEKNIAYLSLCQSFPNIFRVIVLIRATYQLRKKDYEASILNLMDFLSTDSGMSQEDYTMAVEVTINITRVEDQKAIEVHIQTDQQEA